ncbi:MAG: hypothetical protein M1831_003061 [Alyxoria varia]|nr:MAG: hypothetical protein M1831_003061 [Alyxoria varia]
MASADSDAGREEPAPIMAAVSPPKQRYKSWRKKYRKMKLRFEMITGDANRAFAAEHKAEEIASRLQEQNDLLMDLFLELNDSVQTPSTSRFDLDLPSLKDPNPSNSTTGGQTRPNKPSRSLQDLQTRTTHTDMSNVHTPDLPVDLREENSSHDNTDTINNANTDSFHNLPGYLAPSHQEAFTAEIDKSLALLDADLQEYPRDPAQLKDFLKMQSKPLVLSDFAEHSPISVHNWVRRNYARIFGEPMPVKDETRSETGGKSPPPSAAATEKPAAGTSARGSGGGSSRPPKSGKEKDKVLSKQDLQFKDLDDEIDFDARLEEEGLAKGGGGSNRKKKKDDEAYRPKGGKSRSAAAKRKRDQTGDSASVEGNKPKRAKREPMDDEE